MRISGVYAALLVLLAASRPVLAQYPEWSFDAQAAHAIETPGWLSADSLRDALFMYDSGEEIRGLVADLNRDGVTDYILQYSLTTCGTNCQYELIDGATHRSLGTTGGSLVYVGPRVINGYPVIAQYGHSSADSGTWSTLVFDGSQYVSVSSVWLEGAALEQHFERLKDVPYGEPSIDFH